MPDVLEQRGLLGTKPPAWFDPAMSLMVWEKANTTEVLKAAETPRTPLAADHHAVRASSASLQSLVGDALSYRQKRHLRKAVLWASPDRWHRAGVSHSQRRRCSAVAEVHAATRLERHAELQKSTKSQHLVLESRSCLRTTEVTSWDCCIPRRLSCGHRVALMLYEYAASN